MDQIDKLIVPRFSLAERDRRWRLVRKLMAEDGLDAIVTAVNTGHRDHFQANTRYLTGVGGNFGQPAAVLSVAGDRNHVPRGNPPLHYSLRFPRLGPQARER